MPYPILVPAAEADIEDVLAFTLERWGEAKYEQYLALIEQALEALADDPHSGRSRPSIHPDAWVYFIARPGRRARHLFLYEIGDHDTAYIYGLIYDGRDLPRVWQDRGA